MFKYIIGYKIIKVVKIHDYIQLYFDNGAILNIYDEFKCDFKLQNLLLKKVEAFRHKDDVVEIILDDKSLIVIYLYTSDSPERMSLVTKDNKHYVWN